MAKRVDLRDLVDGEYPDIDERLIVPNPVAPKVSKYEGMTVQYTNTRKKLRDWGQLLQPYVVVQLAKDLGLLDDTRERVYAFYTNRKHKPLGYRLISSGGRYMTTVDIPVVFGPALALQAAGIFLLHNHPGGDPRFSRDDYNITKRMVEVGKLMAIGIIDHVAVGGGEFKSMATEGEM